MLATIVCVIIVLVIIVVCVIARNHMTHDEYVNKAIDIRTGSNRLDQISRGLL